MSSNYGINIHSIGNSNVYRPKKTNRNVAADPRRIKERVVRSQNKNGHTRSTVGEFECLHANMSHIRTIESLEYLSGYTQTEDVNINGYTMYNATMRGAIIDDSVLGQIEPIRKANITKLAVGDMISNGFIWDSQTSTLHVDNIVSNNHIQENIIENNSTVPILTLKRGKLDNKTGMALGKNGEYFIGINNVNDNIRWTKNGKLHNAELNTLIAQEINSSAGGNLTFLAEDSIIIDTPKTYMNVIHSINDDLKLKSRKSILIDSEDIKFNNITITNENIDDNNYISFDGGIMVNCIKAPTEEDCIKIISKNIVLPITQSISMNGINAMTRCNEGISLYESITIGTAPLWGEKEILATNTLRVDNSIIVGKSSATISADCNDKLLINAIELSTNNIRIDRILSKDEIVSIEGDVAVEGTIVFPVIDNNVCIAVKESKSTPNTYDKIIQQPELTVSHPIRTSMYVIGEKNAYITNEERDGEEVITFNRPLIFERVAVPFEAPQVIIGNAIIDSNNDEGIKVNNITIDGINIVRPNKLTDCIEINSDVRISGGAIILGDEIKSPIITADEKYISIENIRNKRIETINVSTIVAEISEIKSDTSLILPNKLSGIKHIDGSIQIDEIRLDDSNGSTIKSIDKEIIISASNVKLPKTVEIGKASIKNVENNLVINNINSVVVNSELSIGNSNLKDSERGLIIDKAIIVNGVKIGGDPNNSNSNSNSNKALCLPAIDVDYVNTNTLKEKNKGNGIIVEGLLKIDKIDIGDISVMSDEKTVIVNGDVKANEIKTDSIKIGKNVTFKEIGQSLVLRSAKALKVYGGDVEAQTVKAKDSVKAKTLLIDKFKGKIESGDNGELAIKGDVSVSSIILPEIKIGSSGEFKGATPQFRDGVYVGNKDDGAFINAKQNTLIVDGRIITSNSILTNSTIGASSVISNVIRAPEDKLRILANDAFFSGKVRVPTLEVYDDDGCVIALTYDSDNTHIKALKGNLYLDTTAVVTNTLKADKIESDGSNLIVKAPGQVLVDADVIGLNADTVRIGELTTIDSTRDDWSVFIPSRIWHPVNGDWERSLMAEDNQRIPCWLGSNGEIETIIQCKERGELIKEITVFWKGIKNYKNKQNNNIKLTLWKVNLQNPTDDGTVEVPLKRSGLRWRPAHPIGNDDTVQNVHDSHIVYVVKLFINNVPGRLSGMSVLHTKSISNAVTGQQWMSFQQFEAFGNCAFMAERAEGKVARAVWIEESGTTNPFSLYADISNGTRGKSGKGFILKTLWVKYEIQEESATDININIAVVHYGGKDGKRRTSRLETVGTISNKIGSYYTRIDVVQPRHLRNGEHINVEIDFLKNVNSVLIFDGILYQYEQHLF